jgi:hypothetical protein
MKLVVLPHPIGGLSEAGLIAREIPELTIRSVVELIEQAMT